MFEKKVILVYYSIVLGGFISILWGLPLIGYKRKRVMDTLSFIY